MKKGAFLFQIQCLSLLLLCSHMIGCTSDIEGPQKPVYGQSPDSIYVMLQINIADDNGQTRALPTGGEDGDGKEYGQDNENKVYDLNMVAYYAAEGINSNDKTVADIVYIDELAEPEKIAHNSHNGSNTDTIDCYKVRFYTGDNRYPLEGLHFIVIANLGKPLYNYNDTDPTQIGSTAGVIGKEKTTITLNDIRNCQNTTAWTLAAHETGGTPSVTDMRDYSRFVMANANDTQRLNDYGTPTGAGTSEDNPIWYHIDLERHAARIDFSYNGSTSISNDGILYEIKDGGKPLGNFYLTDMRIVNGAVQPTYMLKRVTTGAAFTTTGITFLGDETATNGRGTNYVIEPRSAQKTVNAQGFATATAANLTTWYGDSRLAASTAVDGSFLRDVDAVHKTAGTTEADCFIPDRYGKFADPAHGNGYVVGYVNENTFDCAATCAEYTTGLLLRGTYVPTVKGYASREYYEAETPTATVDFAKGNSFWRYEPDGSADDESKCIYFSADAFTDQAAADAFANDPKHSGKVVFYANGICYYYIWLRHANSDAAGNFDGIYTPMEYGIVRNNIYRISIILTTGIGAPVPEPRDPERLKSRIYVRKWREVTHPEILV